MKFGGKRTKIVIDIFMTIFLVLSFARWDGDPTFHFIVGTVCTLFFAAHVFIHRKWLRATTKSFIARKIKSALVGKYSVNMLLLVVWGICIVTGFLAIGSFVFGVEWMFVFSRIHGITARVGLVLTIIHIIQHRVQIMSYFRKNQTSNAFSM